MKRKAIIDTLQHRRKDADYNRTHLPTSEARFIEEGKFQAYSIALRMLGESVPVDRTEAESAVKFGGKTQTWVASMSTPDDPLRSMLEAFSYAKKGDDDAPTSDSMQEATIPITPVREGEFAIHDGTGKCLYQGDMRSPLRITQKCASPIDGGVSSVCMAEVSGAFDKYGGSFMAWATDDLWERPDSDDDDDGPDEAPKPPPAALGWDLCRYHGTAMYLPHSVYVLESPNNRGVCGAYYLSREAAQAYCDSVPIDLVVRKKDVSDMYRAAPQAEPATPQVECYGIMFDIRREDDGCMIQHRTYKNVYGYGQTPQEAYDALAAYILTRRRFLNERSTYKEDEDRELDFLWNDTVIPYPDFPPL